MEESTVDISYNHPQNYVVTTFTGFVSYEQLLFTYDKVVNSPKYKSKMGRIWDVTQADLTGLDDEQIWLIAHYSAIYPDSIRKVKAALVSGNPGNLKILKQLKLYSNEVKGELVVFASLDSAIKWISRVPPKS